MDDELYIHVGLTKTGSTFLQKKVFPRMAVNCIIRDEGYPQNAMITGKIEGKTLISDEALSTGGFGFDGIHNECSPYEKADRIHRLYPDAHIIIVLREKEDWLQSQYSQFISRAYRARLVDNYKEWYTTYYLPYFEDIDFDEYAGYLQDVFGDVLVLHFSELKNDTSRFVGKIASYIGVPVPEYDATPMNTSFNPRNIRFLKLCGHIPFQTIRNAARGLLRVVNK